MSNKEVELLLSLIDSEGNIDPQYDFYRMDKSNAIYQIVFDSNGMLHDWVEISLHTLMMKNNYRWDSHVSKLLVLSSVLDPGSDMNLLHIWR